MKSTNLRLLALAALTVISVSFASCDKNDTDEPKGGREGELANGTEISGDITKNTILAKGNTYTLRGGVHVTDGATLTIEEGVTVKAITNSKADYANTAYLLVEPGSKIEAKGTANSPIVFTSNAASPAPQDWGGIILCGRAPINPQGGTAPSEMGAGVVYGGTNAADNSGTLKYVRVEYTGKKQDASKEHNGFTFEGVGNGTTLEYLAVYKGADDGIEFFGGTANLKYAFVNGAQDDLFDWTYGWSGNGQYWVGVQGNDVADRGIEADNNGDNNGLSPLSMPTLSNITLVGSREAKTNDNPDAATDADKGKTIGLKLRAGTAGKLHNFVVYGFNNGVDIQHNITVDNALSGKLVFTNSDLYGPNPFKSSLATLIQSAFFANAVTVSAEDKPAYMNGYVGTTTTGAVNPSTLGSFFTGGNFKGAVEVGKDWISEGTWARK
jgi:hypothetical protein